VDWWEGSTVMVGRHFQLLVLNKEQLWSRLMSLPLKDKGAEPKLLEIIMLAILMSFCGAC